MDGKMTTEELFDYNGRLKITKRDFGELTPEELKMLREKGYDVQTKLGQGQTREAFLAIYDDGGVKSFRVIDYPKPEIDLTNVNTAINTRDNRDVNFNEVRVNCNIPTSPNIVPIVHSFNLNGKVINAMPYFRDSMDLEELVAEFNEDERKALENICDQYEKTTPKQVKKRFLRARENLYIETGSQLLDGALHLEESGILHRDLKPSNVIVVKKFQYDEKGRRLAATNVQISDFQLATDSNHLQQSHLPTKGSGSYAFPELHNALLNGYSVKADPRSEVFSLGGILFNLITGKQAFNRRIVEDPDGKEITVDPEHIFRIKIESNGKRYDHISNSLHEEELQEALKEVPKRYRQLIYRALTTDYQQSIKSVSQLKLEFDRARPGLGRKLVDRVMSGSKFFLPACGISAVVGGIIAGMILLPKQEPGPTMSEMINRSAYDNFNYKEISGLPESDKFTSYSDEKLGVSSGLSTRTVSKYRNIAGIPSAFQRRLSYEHKPGVKYQFELNLEVKR